MNTEHFNLVADGDIDDRRVTATLDIDSVMDFQKEISKLYNLRWQMWMALSAQS